MEEQSIPLVQNGGFCNPPDVVDGIMASTMSSVVDGTKSSQPVSPGLAADGIISSCLRIDDDPEEPSATEPIPDLFLAIEIGDVDTIGVILTQNQELVNSPLFRGFPPLHHACKYKKIQALRELLKYGANVAAYDVRGNTALHLAVSKAWYEGITELLNHGASTNARSIPPTTVRETPLHTAVRNGDLKSTTLLLQFPRDLKIKDNDDSTILHLAARARSLEIVRALLKETACQEMTHSIDRLSNSVLHSALLEECDSVKESTLKEIIKMLIENGASVDAANYQNETPLFLAAGLRLPKVVELLLSYNADPTQVTCKGQTALHAACKSGSSTCLSYLLNTNSMNDLVTKADNEGLDPFHFAVQSSSIDCCELLLTSGDHLSRKDEDDNSRFYLILKNLPSAPQLLKRLFDAHVHLNNKPHHDQDFQINFDYSVLLSPEDDGIQTSLISEFTTSYLEPLLKHPLLESFLYYKWQKIKKFFYISVFLYILYLITHTTFIILTFGHFQINWCHNQGTLWIFIIIHIFLFFAILIPDIFIWLANFKKYLRHLETYTKFIALLSSILVLCSCTIPMDTYLNTGYQVSQVLANQNTTDNVANISFVRHSAATSAFFCWIEFMILLGRFPFLGPYVLMFTRVAKSIIKFMFAFSSLLIGFALCFMVLFYESPIFKNFPLSIIKALMMMIGEIEYGDLHTELQLPTITLIFLVLFLFLVCIVMTNLLIGLAVNDIEDLQRQGKIRRLAKQVAYLVSYEKLIVVARNLGCFPNKLRVLMALRCKIEKKKSVYPNRSCNQHKYKVCLPSETIQEAILLGNCEDTKEDFTSIEEDDVAVLFKSFRKRYNNNQKLLNKKLAQLSDGTTTDRILKEHLDQMQQTVESQLMQFSCQFQQQMQQQQQNFNQWMQLQQQNYQVISQVSHQQQQQQHPSE